MRNRLAAAVLAAVAGVQSLEAVAPAAEAPATPPATPPAGQPADQAAAAVPVKQVVLFSSGVGYFEHYGSVDGSGSTELRFKSAQINDILKSLVLQDLDKGRVMAVTYPSQDPVAKTLKSFQVDITANPSLAQLLNQLRGAEVSVNFAGREQEGTVLGVEKKQRPVGEHDKGQVVEVWFLNLIAGAEIRQVPLDEVRDVRLKDPKLQDELHRALAALAAARDQDKKPVTIRFSGQGKRRLRIGYVVETPVWKTSYRLILAPEHLEEPGRAAPRGSTGPSRLGSEEGNRHEANPKEARLRGEGKLQGWAIVENQTDNDWNDVQLSLVSGRPISFIQDLYQPLYVPRPVVQPELYASLRPQTYDAGMDLGDKQLGRFGSEDRRKALQNARNEPAAKAPAPVASSTPAALGLRPPEGRASEEAEGRDKLAAIDATASIASVASAAKVGELFQYTVGDVSLPRQTSAMIPIVADDIEAEKLSIYNPNVLPRNPLNGARLKNTTGKHLLAGPLTVLEGGSYAGDAQIDNVPPGQERLLSYGVDQQVLVDATKNKQDASVLTGKIVKGVLIVSRRYVFTQDYVAENKGEKDKTLIIEHPRRGEEWKLVRPAKADETTDTLYRFEGRVEAGKGTKLTVEEQWVAHEEVAILPTDAGQLDAYVRTGPIPQPVKDALVKAVGLKNRLADTDRQIQERQQQIQQITAEQNRIRDNMKTVAPSTDYYNRLLKKLDEQETAIEKLQKGVQDLLQTQEKQRKELEDYLANLTVEG